MNEDERMSDTLSKWERISKGSSVREMKLIFKVKTYSHKYKLFKKGGDGKTLILALIPYNSMLMVTLYAF